MSTIHIFLAVASESSSDWPRAVTLIAFFIVVGYLCKNP